MLRQTLISTNLIHVKDQIKLTNILKALVQSLDKNLYQIQNPQLRLRRVHTEDKV